MQTRAKLFNPQIFLELICYSAFGGLILYLVESGKYLSYVTPKMKPYLYFTAAVMLAWSCFGIGRLFRPQHKIRSAHCFVLVLPILFLLLPHSPLGATDLSNNYAGGGGFDQNAVNKVAKQVPSGNTNSGSLPGTQAPAENAGDSATAQQPGSSASSGTQSNEAGLHGLDTLNKKITVENDEFYPWISEIYTNIDKYIGYTISITGFVFKDPQYFAKDEFVPARLAMTCCIADLTPIGMVCKYDKVSELKADSWVTVEGVIRKGQYNGEDEPQITVTNISPADEVEGYVYP